MFLFIFIKPLVDRKVYKSHQAQLLSFPFICCFVQYLMKSIFTLLLAATSLVSGPNIPSSVKVQDKVDNGSPGSVCYADAYNNLGNNWNRTYLSTEPQQVHMSLLDDSKFFRVQFATLEEIDESILSYWPKNHGRHSPKKTTLTGKVGR